MKNLIFILGIFILLIAGVSALPLFPNPGVANTEYNYTFNFTLDSDCTGVLLSNSSSITTNSKGYGFIDLDISSLTAIPSYLCEYRDGSLRKSHALSDQVFKDIFVNSINANDWSNITITESQISDLTHTIDTNRSDSDILNVCSVYNDSSINSTQNIESLGFFSFSGLTSELTNDQGFLSSESDPLSIHTDAINTSQLNYSLGLLSISNSWLTNFINSFGFITEGDGTGGWDNSTGTPTANSSVIVVGNITQEINATINKTSFYNGTCWIEAINGQHVFEIGC